MYEYVYKFLYVSAGNPWHAGGGQRTILVVEFYQFETDSLPYCSLLYTPDELVCERPGISLRLLPPSCNSVGL